MFIIEVRVVMIAINHGWNCIGILGILNQFHKSVPQMVEYSNLTETIVASFGKGFTNGVSKLSD